MERDRAARTMRELMRLMREKGASDLFITVGFPPAIKIDGKITPVGTTQLGGEDAKMLTTCIMNDRQMKEFEATKECNFAVAPQGIGRFRCNAYVQQGNPGLVLRTINTEVPQFDSLRLPPVLKDVVMAKNGLVIFVGGTGSGKSTSLAAMVDHRNRNSYGHIITLEDPIEFVHPHRNCVIMQREVGVDTDSWEVALKNTLRQAPDVILLGEIRDANTMNFGIQFAETGHLAMATMHANNANQALDRVINFFPTERREQLFMDLAANVRAIVSQRLIPTREGKGRCAAVEVLLNTPLAKDIILKGQLERLKELMKRSHEAGMQTFDDAILRLFQEDRISYDDALRYADSQNEVRLKIKLGGDKPESAGGLTGLGHLELEDAGTQDELA